MMYHYAILSHPGHSRVYFEASRGMAVSELLIALRKAGADRGAIEASAKCEKLAGVWYLTFAAEEPLSNGDVGVISGLSFVFALFELFPDEKGPCLRPVEMAAPYMEESVSSILKYTGKTNEVFTRMMINIAAYSREDAGTGGVPRLLDPVAGKGTTLFEGLIKGFDVYGVEIADKIVNEAYHFLKRFLETGRYKHTAESRRISGPNRAFSAERFTFEIARTKEDQRAKDTRTAELIAGNSMFVNAYYKRNFFDMLVGDLPYGVAHGNITSGRQPSLTRNPSELLSACLPAWRDVLKPGGTAVLAWNSFVLPREKMEAIFSDNGFTVFNKGEYLNFSHRVDQAIMRDVIAAKK
ncbi:MAG: DNA methylase [Firmicutes bacterium]|nr:DNA methylase [Bacillota bacterium]